MAYEMVDLRLVFSQPDPASPDLIFVEVETLDGKGVRAGEWEVYLSNGRVYSALRLTVLASDVQL
jgi:hypothetical protein